MNVLADDFNKVIDVWIAIIRKYTFHKLCLKENSESWSLAQVCVHLLNDTNWYIQQMLECLKSKSNKEKNMTAFAETIFTAKTFPNEKMENPNNVNMPQPASKEQLLNSFLMLKKDMNNAILLLQETSVSSKTKHPGFGYFNAEEWLRFSIMHMRHHFKQKENIERFILTN